MRIEPVYGSLTCTGDDCPCTGGLQLTSRSDYLSSNYLEFSCSNNTLELCFQVQCPFCNINNGFSGNFHYKWIVIFLLNGGDFFHHYLQKNCPLLFFPKKLLSLIKKMVSIISLFSLKLFYFTMICFKVKSNTQHNSFKHFCMFSRTKIKNLPFISTHSG